MENLAPTVFDDKETIQNSKGESWHGEKAHGRDDLPMSFCIHHNSSNLEVGHAGMD